MKKSELRQMIKEEVEKLNEARNRLQELNNDYGAGITFVDINETIFHTYAKIEIISDETGKVIKKSEIRKMIKEEIQKFIEKKAKKIPEKFKVGDIFYAIIKTGTEMELKFIKRQIKYFSKFTDGEITVNGTNNIKECGKTKKEAKKLMLNIISAMPE